VSDATIAVRRAEETLAPLLVAAHRASWEVNVAATAANERARVAADVALSDALADPALFDAVVTAREGAQGLERRQLDLVHAAMLASQAPAALRHRIIELESAVESRFAQHRADLGGRRVTENEILAVLRHSPDVEERRAAWEASKTIGAAVADDVRELARLRNEVARGLGFRDWFALSVAESELDEGRLLETLAACDEATVGAFADWKAGTDAVLAAGFGCRPDELRPWHYADPFFQEVPIAGGVDLDPLLADRDVVALAARTFDGIGIDTAAVIARSDLYPREGKCQHAFCLDVDRAGDVRVLANVVDDGHWADTMLHELGHAAFDLGIDPELPFLLRDCHLTVTEGIAILMGGLAREGQWLRDLAGVDRGVADELEPRLRASRTAERLLFARWVLVMTTFERALYADPAQDLDARWWELVERFQGVTAPEAPPAGAWASKIHVGCAPVYYHTYLYGHLIAAQLRAALAREAGGLVGRPAAGAFLRERVFRLGASERWDRVIEHATGEPLTVAHFAAELAPEHPPRPASVT
jgi:peptidyl-dipeptidase A